MGRFHHISSSLVSSGMGLNSDAVAPIRKSGTIHFVSFIRCGFSSSSSISSCVFGSCVFGIVCGRRWESGEVVPTSDDVCVGGVVE